jgi:hypothetical protein
MARAYQVKGSLSEHEKCAQCGYEHQSTMDTKEVFRVEDDNVLFEDDYAHYIVTSVYLDTRKVWFCENCEEWSTDAPETVEESTWRCGECGTNHENEEQARGCCQ